MFNLERKGSETRNLFHKNENCIGCGICSDICPTNSLKLGPIVPIARNLIDMDFISINKDNCVFCGLCSVACPFDALSLEINGKNIKDINYYPKWDVESVINQEECIYCGRCNEACPRDAILFKRVLPSREKLIKGEIEINTKICIYCNICAEMCPSGAITLKCEPDSTNKSVNNVIEVDKSKCVYCGVCKRACPENTIKTICTTCMESEYLDIPLISGEAFIGESVCVNCGWCMEVCPVDAVKITKPFSGSINLIETEELICKGDSCHACQDVCPCKSIEIIDNKANTNNTFCNLCGACIKACPQHIRHLKRDSMNLTNINSESWKEILGKLLE